MRLRCQRGGARHGTVWGWALALSQTHRCHYGMLESCEAAAVRVGLWVVGCRMGPCVLWGSSGVPFVGLEGILWACGVLCRDLWGAMQGTL